MADDNRLTHVGDKEEDHGNQDVVEDHQNVKEEGDNVYDEDESVSANFGSEVDPAEDGSVADATDVGKDVSYPTHEQGSAHEKGSEAKDRTEDGRSKDFPDGDSAGASYDIVCIICLLNPAGRFFHAKDSEIETNTSLPPPIWL
ncbi:hypothetical protein PsorP6_001284 [Peronosclerospora sorghi]|uniref:Uncharacterized protein n=1 Tax=Peronosclerospora sorghi TaxID=230839 RepID=A0ACC0WZ45_9STRA|nr:hypothetical protein PsorP6_001284 [Peronosclerospora sorghi]